MNPKKRTAFKRILYYEPSSGFGGSSSALVHMIKRLNREIFTPIVVINNYGAQIEKLKNTEIIKIRGCTEQKQFLNSLKNIAVGTIKLYLIIKKKRISLVHININVIAGIPAIIASKIAGVPCICHIRETRKLIKREKLFAKWVDIFILLNKPAYQVYKVDLPEKKMRVIYDGIDLDVLSSLEGGSLRNEYNLNSAPTVGVIGRIVEGKGQLEFVLAAKVALQTMPEIKFIIVGDSKSDDGCYFNRVKELVKAEQLSSNVIFAGWRNDIAGVIKDLDIVVLPSTTYPEGLPNAIIEAMVFKKPIIASDIPGPSDIVVNGETGFLVSPGDINAMAEKIIYLLNRKEVAQEMGRKGRIRAEELFNIKKQISKIENIYEEVL